MHKHNLTADVTLGNTLVEIPCGPKVFMCGQVRIIVIYVKNYSMYK